MPQQRDRTQTLVCCTLTTSSLFKAIFRNFSLHCGLTSYAMGRRWLAPILPRLPIAEISQVNRFIGSRHARGSPLNPQQRDHRCRGGLCVTGGKKWTNCPAACSACHGKRDWTVVDDGASKNEADPAKLGALSLL
jgi:hypothetical protein